MHPASSHLDAVVKGAGQVVRPLRGGRGRNRAQPATTPFAQLGLLVKRLVGIGLEIDVHVEQAFQNTALVVAAVLQIGCGQFWPDRCGTTVA
jgi:hypothetical protein